ncbi:ATP-dependent DNA helicase Q5-like isoform X2 [Periplaneta americana]|uniref:ATP-dependent DNA helicase Q5-like isoform X2 n=1 Tax=Periplaneta americana TaxID=6978 RepID=UPI0037E7C0EF
MTTSSRPNLLSELSKLFGYKEFKSDLQRLATEAVLRRNEDVFVSMPTGSGKSLCFQLPAVLQENKVAIVFSPLLALIKDQIDHLQRLRIVANTINSKMGPKERAQVINDLKCKCPTTRLLYVTPEQANTHTFKVVEDIIKQLHLKKPVGKYKTSCYRSNLFYDVVFQDIMEKPFDDLKDFIRDILDNEPENDRPSNRGCGIIYCRTREATEEVASFLTRKGVRTVAYHAGLRTSERLLVQEEWMSGKYPVISATVSFGMGVDKGSVRFVAHWCVPQNLAAYYQESGRAGRDGKPSYCRIYYSKRERKTVDFLLRKEISCAKKPNRKQSAVNAYKNFEKMVEYCEDIKCRHGAIAKYFGDSPPPCKKEKQCDVCKNPGTVEKAVENFNRHSSMQNNLMIRGDGSDLYEGGRRGQKRESDNYRSERDDDDDGEENKPNKQLQELIQKQFSIRRKSCSTEDEETSAKYSRVRAAQSTGVKVNGLTISVRESYLRLLIENLSKNHERCVVVDPPDHKLSSSDIEMCAIDLEYEAFTSNKVVGLYRRTVMKTVGDIKKNTEVMTLNEKLRKYKPTGNSSLRDAVTQITNQFKTEEENRREPIGIVTASQFLKKCDEKLKENTSGIVEKNKKSSRSSIFKRDPLIQQSIHNFCKRKAAESDSLENDSENSTEESTVTEYKEGDTSSTQTSSDKQSLRNVPLMVDDGDCSDSAQEFDCEEYNEEDIMNSEDEVEFSEVVHSEIKSERFEDSKVNVMSKTISQINSNPVVVKREDLHIKQENKSCEFTNNIENSCFLTPVEEKSSVSYCEVRQERTKTVVKTEPATESYNKSNEKKRKWSQTLFGESSDDEITDKTKSKTKRDRVRDIKSNFSLSKLQANKEDSSSLCLKNTNSSCISKRVSVVEEDGSASTNFSVRHNKSQTSMKLTKEEQNTSQNGSTANESGTVRLNKQAIADTVVKHLMPFYKEKKIASRDLFKFLARQVAHHLEEVKNTDESSIKKFVRDFFNVKDTVNSESDVCFRSKK